MTCPVTEVCCVTWRTYQVKSACKFLR